MEDGEGLARLRAALALRGITRREAARRLHLSYGQLNKKLRGDKPLSEAERRGLRGLCLPGGGGQAADGGP